MKPIISRLTIPNKLEYLIPVQAYAKSVSENAGFEPDAVNEIELALEEAVTKIIKYGFEADEQAAFDIEFEVSIVGLRIILREKGDSVRHGESAFLFAALES